MKVLWFTSTPSNASAEFGYHSSGCGWISSLETLIAEQKSVELGICFYYEGELFRKLVKRNVTYYGIPRKRKNLLSRILARHFVSLEDYQSLGLEKVLEEFQPDLLHVFGTENGFGKALVGKSSKVIFHLQGLLTPISEVYFPPRLNKWLILKNSPLTSLLRGVTFFHHFKSLKKRAEQELDTLRAWKYFTGRTTWDRNFLALINPNAAYFHCDEIIRSEFYLDSWNNFNNITIDSEIIIGSTLRPNIYKGLNLIYDVIKLLQKHNICWKVFGVEKDDPLNKLINRISKNENKNINIQFYGQVDGSELVDQIKNCHFFVHPSYIDNSPNSVCEAMLLGMPVISSSVGGTKSLIKDGETGFLFNPYDKYDLAGIIDYLISNFEVAKQVGENARKAAIERHSPDSIIQKLVEIYNFVLKNED